MTKVSVIIPVFNAEAFIRESLNSALAQTLREIEVICIDDGSTDSTADIISNIRGRDGRIILLTQKNAGSGAARNLGLSAAKGEFITFLDGDDWYPTQSTLQSLYTAAAVNNVKIAGGSFVRHFSDGRVVDKFEGIYSAYTFERAELLDFESYQFDYGYHRFIYRRQMLIDHSIDFPIYKRFQDPPFFVRAMVAAKTFFSLPDRVYAYRKGHQIISWDAEKVEGALLGLTDNLLLSRNEGLNRLHVITYTRFVREFLKIILPHAKGNFQIYFCMKRLLDAVDPSMLRSLGGGEFFTESLPEEFAWEAYQGVARAPRQG